jgi:hypothetical protein
VPIEPKECRAQLKRGFILKLLSAIQRRYPFEKERIFPYTFIALIQPSYLNRNGAINKARLKLGEKPIYIP